MGINSVSGVEFNRIIVNSLFPSKNSVMDTVTMQDLLYPKTDPSGMAAVLNYKYVGSRDTTYNPAGKLNSVDYRQYLQMGNQQVKQLVNTIVSPGDSNDEKADKILNWVQNNITYVSDEIQYHSGDYWAKPTETLKSREGDCEDGAFLIHSMLLAAGVPADRIRTYAGLVDAGTNAPMGGHAWTVYKRETDNQWVDLDWCYYPDDTAVDQKETFKAQSKYEDAYWWMNAFGTYDEYGKWGINVYA
jgi:transglutaminase-like putative cysteine protease